MFCQDGPCREEARPVELLTSRAAGLKRLQVHARPACTKVGIHSPVSWPTRHALQPHSLPGGWDSRLYK